MVLVLHKSKAMGECITLGYSREPPVATFFGRRQRLDEHREVVWYMPKRLPSRLWEQTGLVDVPAFRGRGRRPDEQELIPTVYRNFPGLRIRSGSKADLTI